MSNMTIKYEDWLCECVHHDGEIVYLPCDTVLAIADWIEAHRDAVPVVRCKDCQYYHQTFCEIWSKYGTIQTREQGFCYMAERRDDE